MGVQLYLYISHRFDCHEELARRLYPVIHLDYRKIGQLVIS